MSIVEYNTKGMLDAYEKARRDIRNAWLNVKLEKLGYDENREAELISIAGDLQYKSVEKMIVDIEALQ